MEKEIISIMLDESLSDSEEMRSFIKNRNETEKGGYVTYIQFEFIFLFIHLISREYLNKFDLEKRDVLIDKIAITLFNTYVHVKMPTATEDQKEVLKQGIFTNLNNAESQYGECKEILSKENPLADSAVISLFSKKIANICNGKAGEDNLDLILRIISITSSSWLKIKNLTVNK
jgi:hypothetical protein